MVLSRVAKNKHEMFCPGWLKMTWDVLSRAVLSRSHTCVTRAKRGSRGLRVIAPCICLEMRLGERTRLTKFGELTQDRQHPELTPET